MTNGLCVHFCTPLANYCAWLESSGLLSPGGALGCPGRWLVWNVPGLYLCVQERPAASAPAWIASCLPCVWKGWMLRIAELYFCLALIPPGRLKDFFFFFWCLTQASCFHTALFFFLTFWPVGFLLWLLLHPMGLACGLVLCPSQPRFLHHPWFVVSCLLVCLFSLVLLCCLLQSACSFCSIQALKENDLSWIKCPPWYMLILETRSHKISESKYGEQATSSSNVPAVSPEDLVYSGSFQRNIEEWCPFPSYITKNS